MIYEHRIYTCVPGRLPAILKRFDELTLPIWKRHGFRALGFWTVAIGDGSNDLYYVLAWDSLAEREEKWAAFIADPEWKKGKAESEKDGPIVANIRSTILEPTSFSALK